MTIVQNTYCKRNDVNRELECCARGSEDLLEQIKKRDVSVMYRLDYQSILKGSQFHTILHPCNLNVPNNVVGPY